MPGDRTTAEWPKRKIGDLIVRHFSGPSPTCEERCIWTEQEWGLLKTTAITWAGWNETAHKVLPRGYWNQPELEVRADDVLVTKAGPRERVGVVVHVPQTRPRLIVSGKMIGLRPDPREVDPRILALLIAGRDAQKYLDDRTTGMAESQVNFANAALLSTPLRVPHPAEQQQIAAVLDTIDEAIQKTEQIIAKLKQVKQGLLHDLLTRGIDHNGELRDPLRHPEQFKDSALGKSPKEWEVATVGELCSEVVDCPHSTPVFAADGPFVARTTQIKAGRFDFDTASHVSEREYAKRVVRLEPKAGDIIFTREAPVGEAFVVPAGVRICLGQRVMLLRPESLRLDARYFVAQVYSGAVARRIDVLTGGTTNPHLNVAEVRGFRLPCPPIAEQRRIVEALATLDERIAHEMAEATKLGVLKGGLSEDLLTGRVRTVGVKA